MSEYIIINGELYHHGIKGMRWGVRKDKVTYKSTGIRAALAKRSNDKVDKSFKNWNDNAEKRDNAIDLGKKANEAKLAYERNKSDKSLKQVYKQANKDYKKALGSNTTYRKGVVRQEVGRDAARKYLSEAKKIKKVLDNDPSNKALQKQYNDLMSKHDVERANARRAVEVSAKRSNKKASIKRTMTVAAKTAATAAAVSAGVYAVNRYFNSRQVTLNGRPVNISSNGVYRAANFIKIGKDLLGYLY